MGRDVMGWNGMGWVSWKADYCLKLYWIGPKIGRKSPEYGDVILEQPHTQSYSNINLAVSLSLWVFLLSPWKLLPVTTLIVKIKLFLDWVYWRHNLKSLWDLRESMFCYVYVLNAANSRLQELQTNTEDIILPPKKVLFCQRRFPCRRCHPPPLTPELVPLAEDLPFGKDIPLAKTFPRKRCSLPTKQFALSESSVTKTDVEMCHNKTD